MTYKYQQRLTALMVDDDVDFLSLVRRILRTLDIDLIATETKVDFLKQLKQLKPNFCLVDLNIKGVVEGFSIIQETRAAGIEVPLFVVSADSALDAVTHALEIGATDYFTKPLNREVLEKKLSYYLKDAISANSNKAYSVISAGPFTVQIEFASQLDSVDEFGIKFKSAHLLPKGTLVKISGNMVKEITGQEKVLTSVMSNSLDSESRLYIYYAEFEEITEDCMNNIRKWLSGKSVSAAA